MCSNYDWSAKIFLLLKKSHKKLSSLESSFTLKTFVLNHVEVLIAEMYSFLNLQSMFWRCLFAFFVLFSCIFESYSHDTRTNNSFRLVIRFSCYRNFCWNLPESSHGDDSIPKWCRNWGESWIGCILLAVEDYSSKYNDGHSQWKNKEAQFWGTGLQRVPQNS